VFGHSLVDLQNFGNGGEPDHIDPALAQTVQASQPGELLFDGLTAIDPRSGQLKPAVAESWTSNPDLTQWTFTLRKGVTFSDGEPVLPSDFKFAWERVVDKALASKVSYHVTDDLKIKGSRDVNEGRAKEISGLIADDGAGTLTIALEAPLSFLPDVVSHLAFSPVPKKVVQALPDPSKYEETAMIGDGPYKMAEPWKHNQYVKLVRNDSYWGGINGHKAYIDAIEFRISKDVDSAYTAFEAGQGDTGYVPPGQVAEARAKYAGRIAANPTAGVSYWGFNMRDPVVGGPDNVKLRQAISLAIDKKAIADTLYGGLRKVATAWAPPLTPGYQPGLSQFPDRDLARARQLVAEWEQATGKKAAGLPPIKLNFNAGSNHEPVATRIQANLAEVGVRSDLDPRDPKLYNDQMKKGEGQFLRSGWIADYNVYDNLLFPVFGSSQVGVGDNVVQYASPKFDSLIDQARRTGDPAFRTDLYHRAEATVLNDDTAVVPLNWYAGQVVYASRVHNVIQSPLQYLAYDEMWLSS
jgi:ABC-type transport system substrate-binding protein